MPTDIPVPQGSSGVAGVGPGHQLAKFSTQRFAGTFLDQTALVALPPEKRVHGHVAVTLDTPSLWAFDIDSAGTPSSTLLACNVGPGQWKQVSDGGGGGSVTESAVRAALAAATADIAVNNQKVTLMADGVLDTDAGSNGQLNRQSTKQTCTASSTTFLPACTYANGTLGAGATLTGNANGALTAQDGQTLAAGLSLFVRFQVAPEQNGRYDVTQIGDAGTPFILTRSKDADIAAKLRGSVIAVAKGTLYSGTLWVLPLKTSDITVGTTALTWVNLGMTAADKAKLDTIAQSADVTATALAAGNNSLGGFKLTGMGAGSANGDSVRYEQIAYMSMMWGCSAAPAAAADRWYNFSPSGTVGINDTIHKTIFGQSMTIRASQIVAEVALSTDSVASTVQKNGVDTTNTSTMAATTLTSADTTHTFAISATDYVVVKLRQSSTQAQAAWNARARVLGSP